MILVGRPNTKSWWRNFGDYDGHTVDLLVRGHWQRLTEQRVITRVLPNVQGWTVATAPAGIAWLAGMGGSSLVQAVGPIGLIPAVPAWLIGVLVPVAVLSAVPNSAHPAVHGVAAVLGAVAMGGIVGAITSHPLAAFVPTDDGLA